VISEGDGRHAVFLGLLDQIANADGAVEEGVLTVEMKMNEGGSFHIYCKFTRDRGNEGRDKKTDFSKREALRQPVSCRRTERILAPGSGTGQGTRITFFQLD
jgi:hypothetical protein